jgi:hypothetical protein
MAPAQPLDSMVRKVHGIYLMHGVACSILTSQSKGEPTMQPTLTNPPRERRVQTKTASQCAHGRIVDEVRSANGAKTGRLVCIECRAEFPDPLYQDPGN